LGLLIGLETEFSQFSSAEGVAVLRAAIEKAVAGNA
jgi:hypothetical protein